MASRFPSTRCLALSLLTITLGEPPTIMAYEPITRVACVGDSITTGVGVKNEDTDSYPAQLQSLLGRNWDVGNFGVNGATLLRQGDRPCWNQRALEAALAFLPDVVVIALGTNDAKPANQPHHGDFVSDYIELIRRFEALSSEPEVFIVIPPGVSQSHPSGITESTVRETITPLIREVIRQTGVPTIDWNTALPSTNSHMPDGLHPNRAGYTRLADAVASALAPQPAS